MTPRRSVYDPLEPTREARWYEVRDMHDRVVESRLLPAGTNTSTPAGSWASLYLGKLNSRTGAITTNRAPINIITIQLSKNLIEGFIAYPKSLEISILSLPR
jgi:hypothetical protein